MPHSPLQFWPQRPLWIPARLCCLGLRQGLGLLVLLGGLLLGAASAWAHDFIAERAYVEDPQNRLDVNTVQSRQTTPYEGVLARGYFAGTVWVRLRVDPARQAGPSDVPLVLSLRPSYLDDVELHDPARPGAPARRGGDRSPRAAQERLSTGITFEVPRGEQPRDLWLRIQTTSTLMLEAQLLTVDEQLQRERRQGLIHAFIFALQALLIVLAAAHWLARRDLVLGLFIVQQASSVFYALAVFGYLRLFFGHVAAAPLLDAATSLSIFCYAFTTGLFEYLLLRDFRPPRGGLLVLRAWLGCVVGALLCHAFVDQRLALHINSLAVLTLPFITTAIALRARAWAHAEGQDDRPLLPRGVLVAFFASGLWVVVQALLPMLGWAPAGELVISGVVLYGLISGGLMLFLLVLRARRQDQRQLELQAQIDTERRRRVEQWQFTAMLAHELKTPLSVLRMALPGVPDSGQPGHLLHSHAQRALQDMADLIDRCVQAGRIEDGATTLERAPCDLLEVAEDACRKHDVQRRVTLQAPARLPLRGDAQILYVLLSNLIDNALKYSPTDTPVDVRITAAAQDTRAGFAVTVSNLPGDAGWPEPSRVFEKYYRAPRARHRTGSGLGLYLVSQLARMSGGQVRYRPDATHVVFDLWLPT